MTALVSLQAVGIAMFALWAIAGCDGKQGRTGPPIQNAEAMRPDALHGKAATLIYGGTPIDVSVERVASGPVIKFILAAHGQALETETYRLDAASFSLVSIDEQFDPPLTLLKFPMHVGDTWEWKGSLAIGTLSHKASAKVSTREEKLIVGKRDPFTLRVDIALDIASGADEPAKRQLTFWFERGRGIVQREVGTATVRKAKE